MPRLLRLTRGEWNPNDCGFHGTTTRLLAERVGISEAALYHYFTSKEALYAAIFLGGLRVQTNQERRA